MSENKLSPDTQALIRTALKARDTWEESHKPAVDALVKVLLQYLEPLKNAHHGFKDTLGEVHLRTYVESLISEGKVSILFSPLNFHEKFLASPANTRTTTWNKVWFEMRKQWVQIFCDLHEVLGLYGFYTEAHSSKIAGLEHFDFVIRRDRDL